MVGLLPCWPVPMPQHTHKTFVNMTLSFHAAFFQLNDHEEKGNKIMGTLSPMVITSHILQISGILPKFQLKVSF